MGQLVGNQDDIRAETPMPVDNMDNTSVVYSVPTETVTFFYNLAGVKTSATGQAAGTLIYAKLGYDGILNSLGTAVANANDTSFAFVTGTVLTTQVKNPGQHFVNSLYKKTLAQKFTEMALHLTTNGEFFIDHENGAIWGLSADTVADDTAGYDVKTTLTGGGAGDKVDVTKVGGTAVPIMNEAFGTSTGLLPIGGKYMSTPTTYDDNDAAPILLDAQGRIVLSSDLQIGAVEIKDSGSDNRTQVLAPNVANYDFGMTTMPARYMASPPLLSNSFGSPLILDDRGNLKIVSSGTSKYENPSYAETESEANDSEFTTSVIYGYDSEGSALSKLRAVQVAIDNTGVSTTPNVLITGAVYKAALDTYTDNDATPIPTTANGVPIMAITSGAALTPIFDTAGHKGFVQLTNGTIEPIITAAFTETLALATDYLTVGGLCYGMDADNAGAPILAAMQVAVDNATISATPNVLVTGGIYKVALDTYNDNDATPFHFSSKGVLLSQPHDGTTGAMVLNSTLDALYVAITDGTTVAPVNTAFAITEAAAQASLFTTGLVMGWDNAGSSLSAIQVCTDNAAASATSNVLITGGVYKSSDDTYGDNDGVPNHYDVGGWHHVRSKSYDTGTTSDKVFEVAPVSTHHVEETLATATSQGNVTVYYYMDMDGYRNLCIQTANTSGGAGDNTYTIEATLQDDGTAEASCTYQDVTAALSGVASWVDTGWFLIVDTPMAFKYVRVKVVRANDGGGTDGAWTIFSKKMF